MKDKEQETLSSKIQGITDGAVHTSLNSLDVEDVKEFIKKRVFDATMLLGKFNAGTLTSIDLREHRQRIKDEAGKELIE